jgi:hypothetical protein
LVLVYSSLDRVDIVGDAESGGKVYIQTDHRSRDEIADELPLSILFALTRIFVAHRMAAEDGPESEVRYVFPAEAPPAQLCQAVAAAGASMEADGQTVPFDGADPDNQDPYTLADAAMAELGHQVMEREGISADEAGLEQLERHSRGAAPDPEEDEIEYWTLRVELAAVAGELLRRLTGGRWVQDEHNLSAFPFAFVSDGDEYYNVFGRVERLFDQGLDEGPRRLLAIVADKDTGAGTTMFSIKPGGFADNDVLCRPLLELDEKDPEIPVMVYGEDRPQTFAHFPYSDDGFAKMEQYHQEALRLLKSVEVQVLELDLAGSPMLVVTGHYYAAEKILDPEFMQRMHEGLRAELLVASIPRKGVLFVANAVDEAVGRFLHVTEMKFNEPETGEPICKTPFLIQGGEIVGLARPEAAEPPPSQPSVKQGWFGKYFKKH